MTVKPSKVPPVAWQAWVEKQRCDGRRVVGGTLVGGKTSSNAIAAAVAEAIFLFEQPEVVSVRIGPVEPVCTACNGSERVASTMRGRTGNDGRLVRRVRTRRCACVGRPKPDAIDAFVVHKSANHDGRLDEDESEDDITDAQIERFEQEAGEAGDLEAVAICRRAIAGDDSARAEVAEWIAEGEAMRDSD